MPTTSPRSDPIVIDLPWQSPPLRSNDRRHWRAEHAAKSEAKQVARVICAQAQRQHGTITHPVTATIIWHVMDHRRRDAGASSPTLKVVLDAAVQVGLLPDDRHEIVTEERCRIQIGRWKGVTVELADDDDADSSHPTSPVPNEKQTGVRGRSREGSDALRRSERGEG